MLSLYAQYIGFKGQMVGRLRRFFQEESGATAIEYGLIAVLIAVAVIGGVASLGTAVNDKFQSVAEKMPQ